MTNQRFSSGLLGLLKKFPVHNLIVFSGILILLSHAAWAGELLDDAQPVPMAIESSHYQELSRRKISLDLRRQEIEDAVVELNAECSHVASTDSDKVVYCSNRQGELYVRMEDYDRDLAVYQKAIGAAVENHPRPNLNADNFSTTGFWLEWLQKIRDENHFVETELRVYNEDLGRQIDALIAADRKLDRARTPDEIARAEEEKRAVENRIKDIKKNKDSFLKPKALAVVATAAFRAGQYDQSVQYFEKALEADPSNEDLRKALGFALYQRDELSKTGQVPKERTTILLDVLQSHPNDFEASIKDLKAKLAREKDPLIREDLNAVLNYVEGLAAYDAFENDRLKKYEETLLFP